MPLHHGRASRKKSAKSKLTLKMYNLLGKDFLANPCRGIVARRSHFAVKRQSQA
jgi:hypothetical protein